MSEDAGKRRYSVLIFKIGSGHHNTGARLCDLPLTTNSHKIHTEREPGFIQVADLLRCRDVKVVVQKLDLSKTLAQIKNLERLMVHSVYRARQIVFQLITTALNKPKNSSCANLTLMKNGVVVAECIVGMNITAHFRVRLNNVLVFNMSLVFADLHKSRHKHCLLLITSPSISLWRGIEVEP